MLSKLSRSLPPYRRQAVIGLVARLAEERRFLQVVVGPRQVGKTTVVRQAIAADPTMTSHLASADDPGLRDRGWLEAQWQVGRVLAAAEQRGAVLVLDEIQTIPDWSEIVKRLWDEDSTTGVALRVVILGSAPLLVQRGLADSIAGRFEVIRLGHWTFGEMRDAFGWDLERFLVFGGYPGSAPLVDDVERWRAYMFDSLVETTLSRDILLLNRVDKPALLRQLFRLGCRSTPGRACASAAPARSSSPSTRRSSPRWPGCRPRASPPIRKPAGVWSRQPSELIWSRPPSGTWR